MYDMIFTHIQIRDARATREKKKINLKHHPHLASPYIRHMQCTRSGHSSVTTSALSCIHRQTLQTMTIRTITAHSLQITIPHPRRQNPLSLSTQLSSLSPANPTLQ